MTRVLVCGGSIFDDPNFVHNALSEVHRIQGPITCVIHNNHVQALGWQQWASRKQKVRHLPVTEDYKRDGVAAGTRCRDRMFEAAPDLVVVFAVMPGKGDAHPAATSDRVSKTEYIVRRAGEQCIPVLRYLYNPALAKLRRDEERAAAQAAEIYDRKSTEGRREQVKK